jgi:hypothetical protein
MEAPYHRFRFTERKIADCPPRPQLPISADEHRESEITELQDTPEFTFFGPCHHVPPCRELGIGGRVTVIPARIKSFQGVAAPFSGDSVLPRVSRAAIPTTKRLAFAIRYSQFASY